MGKKKKKEEWILFAKIPPSYTTVFPIVQIFYKGYWIPLQECISNTEFCNKAFENAEILPNTRVWFLWVSYIIDG